MNFGQGFQGAIGGALGGGGFGGPAGALIGGGLGLLGGLFGGGGGEAYRNRLSEMEREFAGRSAPTLGPAGQAGYSDFRGNQGALIAQLEALSRGQGPSLAAMQMREFTDRAAGSQASMAAGAAGRGSGAGGAYRNAANNTAAIQSQGARDTGMMRVQEQMGALNQLGLTLHGARGADESMNRFNTGAQNDFQLAQLDAQLRAQGMNDQNRLQALQMAMGGAGPGMGTQLLAGGASMFPYLSGQRAAGRGSAGSGPNYGAMSMLPGGRYYDAQPGMQQGGGSQYGGYGAGGSYMPSPGGMQPIDPYPNY